MIVGHDGHVLGQLPPFEASTPWWMDAPPVVRGAFDAFGVRVALVRILDTERPSAHGGHVTYLAEVDDAEAATEHLLLCDVRLTQDPKRLPYAEVGGPRAELSWAEQALAALRISVVGQPEQLRTWNLSSIWSIPTTAGLVWLKAVPPFFAHEGALIEHLAQLASVARVPIVVASDGQRMLLADIDGTDRYDAALAERLEMIDRIVALQAACIGRVDELLRLGLPDWRGAALQSALHALIERRGPALDARHADLLAAFVRDLPLRHRAIDDCGIADSLLHGDFHPGNVRGDGTTMTILDWGDAGVAHPLLDEPAFLRTCAPHEVPVIQDHWASCWRAALPGSDPARAAELLRPVAAARQALIYQRFLDGIEASEQRYHEADVPDWLARTVALLEAERD